MIIKKFLKEFRDFAIKWNVIDLAVGIVIGWAFASITNSLVNSVIMPLAGIVLDGIDFVNLSVGLGDAQIMYGEFIQAIIEFVIIAFALFIIIKAINTAKEKVHKAALETPETSEHIDEPPQLTIDQELLKEIRDLLESQQSTTQKTDT